LWEKCVTTFVLLPTIELALINSVKLDVKCDSRAKSDYQQGTLHSLVAFQLFLGQKQDLCHCVLRRLGKAMCWSRKVLKVSVEERRREPSVFTQLYPLASTLPNNNNTKHRGPNGRHQNGRKSSKDCHYHHFVTTASQATPTNLLFIWGVARRASASGL
jgi:hypothetical protein